MTTMGIYPCNGNTSMREEMGRAIKIDNHPLYISSILCAFLWSQIGKVSALVFDPAGNFLGSRERKGIPPCFFVHTQIERSLRMPRDSILLRRICFPRSRIPTPGFPTPVPPSSYSSPLDQHGYARGNTTIPRSSLLLLFLLVPVQPPPHHMPAPLIFSVLGM